MNSISRADGSALQKADIYRLKASIKGHVVVKGEAPEEEYRVAVHRWNEAFTQDASLIVYVNDEEDVCNCIRFAVEHNLDTAVAGGRHSYHGASSAAGLIIDLRRMRKATVDKTSKTITAQGGCLAEDLEKLAEADGLSVVMGAQNETGIGGLTTGGGVGWLSGRYGLVADNLLSARVALADGRIVKASDEENPDLFWGIRGAGGNFGIVTEFIYQAHEQGPVFFQTVTFSPDKLRECVRLAETMHSKAAEDADGRFQVMMTVIAPGGLPHRPAYIIFYDGPEEQARKLAAPLYDLGPIHLSGGMTKYSAVTEIHKQMPLKGFKRVANSSAQMDWPIDEDILLNVIFEFENIVRKHGDDIKPSFMFIDLRNYQQVMSRPVTTTAFANRDMGLFFGIELMWDSKALDETMIQEASDFAKSIRQQIKNRKIRALDDLDSADEKVVVYPNLSDGTERVASVFGRNLPRLRELKAQYDLEFMWGKWHPIPPGEAN